MEFNKTTRSKVNVKNKSINMLTFLNDNGNI